MVTTSPQSSLISIPLWLTCLCMGTSQAAAPPPPSYHLEGVHAAIYQTPLTTADLKKPLTMSALHRLLSQENSLLDCKRLDKLLTLYATQLTPVCLPHGHVEALVEKQLQAWHQEGMTAADIKEKLGVNTMEKVRKKLKEAYKKQLLCDTFLQRLLVTSPPSPAQVEDFYHRYIAPSPPQVPLKVVLVQLAFYPKKGGSLEETQQYMQGVYEHLSHITNPQKRIKAFCATLRQHLRASPHPFTYGFLLNADNRAQLTLQELSKELQQVLGTIELTAGSILPPTPFVDEYGNQGMRILILESCTRPHPLNLSDDYEYIQLLFLQFHQQRNLQTWWEQHEEETEVYGS